VPCVVELKVDRSARSGAAYFTSYLVFIVDFGHSFSYMAGKGD